jgi:hypothetical protein
MSKLTFPARAAAAAGAAALSLAAVTGLGSAQLAMTPHPPAPVRPVWDGYGTYTGGVRPLCPARDAGNAARLADGTLVECVIDGRQYGWNVMAGCVIPGTHVQVPSLEGARFAGAAHSCVNGTWEPFSAKDNAR